MQKSDLEYQSLSGLIGKYENKGRGESASFLNWFLENIYRLDETTADDAICDQSLDKGIDGIYVDHSAEEIHLFQSKISQKKSSIGDVSLKEFAGSIEQFRSKESIESILSGNANVHLKKIIERNSLSTLVEQGYSIVGVFVTNSEKDENTNQYLKISDSILVFCAEKITENFIEFDADEGVKEKFSLDTSYAGMIDLSVDKDTHIYVLPVSASELVRMDGIADGVLFSQNVRYSLGNTPVNKAISKSIFEKAEHRQFPLYHNGITIICKSARHDMDAEKLEIEDFVVVNGAQSISTFFHNSSKLTEDLRVFVKVVSLNDQTLARKITINSNNQNSIKPRDLRSNHDLMLRLRAEFEKNKLGYEFEIKRGQTISGENTVISNEEAGRLLLAFDLNEPYSCHQIYRVFDEKYAQIFGRPEVTVHRIVFLYELMQIIFSSVDSLKNKPLSKYTLTRFLVVDIVSQIMRMFSDGRDFLRSESRLSDDEDKGRILEKCREILGGLIVDMNYEVSRRGDALDYKKESKSPESVREWREILMKSYEKDFLREKAPGFGDLIE